MVKKLHNDYFLTFNWKTAERVIDPDIPYGYAICFYRDVYIPVGLNGPLYRGSGTNADTQNVPVYYMQSARGSLGRAVLFCKKLAHNDENNFFAKSRCDIERMYELTNTLWVLSNITFDKQEQYRSNSAKSEIYKNLRYLIRERETLLTQIIPNQYKATLAYYNDHIYHDTRLDSEERHYAFHLLKYTLYQYFCRRINDMLIITVNHVEKVFSLELVENTENDSFERKVYTNKELIRSLVTNWYHSYGSRSHDNKTINYAVTLLYRVAHALPENKDMPELETVLNHNSSIENFFNTYLLNHLVARASRIEATQQTLL